jgi:hypothetical protein
MVFNKGMKNGLNGNWGAPGASNEYGSLEHGSGAPAHAAPQGTIYIDLAATPGTTSIYRNTTGSDTWAANSDD